MVGLLWEGIKLAAKTSAPVVLGRILYEFTWGDGFVGEIDAAKRKWDETVGWAREAAQFISDIASGGREQIIRRLLAQDQPDYAVRSASRHASPWTSCSC